ncbi:hydrogen gas-evolving membrane-bound hydrogenase subunit E [Pusillimonas sp.]|uniref:hydrogen gas-evolving membrane-bound hydrogenase subunit E n=1 Tax=Pusillimonas sp. TaxID=3040095 RepID=UPI0037C7754E
MTLLSILSLACFGSVVGWRVALLEGTLTRYLPALLPVGLFIAFAQYVRSVAAGEVVSEFLPWVPSLDVVFSLRLDGFSLLFALLITGIGTLVVLYATAYFSTAARRDRARFTFLILAFMATMLGTVLSDDLIVMFVFWEATSFLSFLLIGFESHKAGARKAALQSLLVTGSGGLALFAGILLVGIDMGTFSLTEISERADELLASQWLAPAVILIMLGAFAKSAQFPFHFWLPQAMAAPTPASAYLHSATMVKLGVYLLARFDHILADLWWYGDTLVIIGMATMLVAAAHAIRSTGYKAVLAQSTVASLGILVMLIGLNGPTAVMAACAFMLAHAFYKAALFFCAGTAIHATSISDLRRLGGLGRFLPFTALAAILASMSMAGFPPFLGFISKEFLFEAQLGSNWNAIPVVVAVIVNSVMVAIAAVVSLRPFVRSRHRPASVLHGESPGLLAGPLVLGFLGVVVGVAPGFFSTYLITPAVVAIYGAPVEMSISLWHGLTPMLALSGVVILLGTVLAWKWDAVHHGLANTKLLSRVEANAVYQAVVDVILASARWSTQQLQNGDMRRYTLMTSLALVGISAWSISHSTDGTLSFGGKLYLLPAALLIFAVLGAVTAACSRELLLGLIGVGVVGYGSALIFLLHGAPDLALTQFAVETLVLIVLMAVMVRLPDRVKTGRSARERTVDLVVAAAFGIVVFVALASMLAQPFDSRLSEFFGASSFFEAHGRNVVNVIIVDYRALDTLGEIAVVGFATLGVWGLLRRRNRTRSPKTAGQHNVRKMS